MRNSCAGSLQRWRCAAGIPGRQQLEDLFHGLATTRAGDDVGWLCGRNIRRADVENPPGVEGDALAFELGRGMAEAKVTHGPQATREDVAEVALDELRTF